MKRVLVIVVTYNGMRWLERCLSSIPAWADAYVVDNASADGSADYVAAHFPQAKLVRSAENLGFSKPNNMGFEYAREQGYDYVYLLNQDAWLEEGTLEKLVTTAEAHPEYGVLSPMQYQDGYQQLDKQFEKRYTSSVIPSKASGSPVEVDVIMAAHWLVPVCVIKRIGPFEETLFPLYGQDDDWCNRLHFSGLKIGIVPEARAVHDRAQRKEPLEKVVYRNYYMGSLVRLCDPSRPLWERFLFVMVFTWVKAVKYGSLSPFKYFFQLVRELPRVRARRKAL